jgi:hypothetical protein
MSSDFLSRVHAEALRRIEAERFEAAVIAEMVAIRRAEWKAEQIPLYHAFHEERKVKLREACEAGRIAPTVAQIETAISEYALDNITLDDVYVIIESVDRNYPHTYANSRVALMVDKGRMDAHGRHAPVVLVGPARPGVPLKFQLYLERALGVNHESADAKKSQFNNVSMASVN